MGYGGCEALPEHHAGMRGRIVVHGIAHITGGGFYENIPRALPEGLTARIEKAALRIIMDQDREISQKSGVPPLAIKTIKRTGKK